MMKVPSSEKYFLYVLRIISFYFSVMVDALNVNINKNV